MAEMNYQIEIKFRGKKFGVFQTEDEYLMKVPPKILDGVRKQVSATICEFDTKYSTNEFGEFLEDLCEKLERHLKKDFEKHFLANDEDVDCVYVDSDQDDLSSHEDHWTKEIILRTNCECDYIKGELLEFAKNGDWERLPERRPSCYQEIVNIAAGQRWDFEDIHSMFVPNWLREALWSYWEEESYCRRHQSSNYDYGYGYNDFDYAMNDGRYAEDSWSSYGSYVLDH